MSRGTLTFKDLRPSAQELRRFADQFSDPPAPTSSSWSIPKISLGRGVSLEADWNDGPTI